jgi:hypothetical protein
MWADRCLMYSPICIHLLFTYMIGNLGTMVLKHSQRCRLLYFSLASVKSDTKFLYKPAVHAYDDELKGM